MAIEFGGGANDEVQFGNVVDITTEDFVVSIMFFLDAYTTTAGTWLWTKGGAGDPGYNISIGRNSGGIGPRKIRFNVDDGTNTFATSNTDVPLKQWNHLLVNADRSGSAVISLNGVNDGGGAINASSGSLTNVSNLEMGVLGSFNKPSIIDEAAIWVDTLLTTVEIQNLASRVKKMPLQIQTDKLSIYCPMDDGKVGTSASGETVGDRSLDPVTKAFNGNDGSGLNNVTWRAGNLSYPGDVIVVQGVAVAEIARLSAMTKQIGLNPTHYGIGTN